MSDQNISRIKVVHSVLGELADQVVFVGGATVSLYADRPAGETRPTDDVDVLVELLNYKDYSALGKKLRAKGFLNDMESGIICRYKVKGIIVDIMPTEGNILGFTNIWYPEGYSNSINKNLGDGYNVKIFQSPYFIASKLEAFRNRGKNDGRMSSDFEDIVYVFNNRTTVWNEMEESSKDLKRYLYHHIRTLLKKDYFFEWISAHLDFNEQRRVNYIIGGLENLISKSKPPRINR